MVREEMDAVFRALAGASRRKILDIVRAKPGCNVNEVAAHFRVSRITVMKHLKVLEEAGLIHSERVGRTRKLFFNAVPIQMIYDRWTDELAAYWAGRMSRVKYQVELRSRAHRGKRRSRRRRHDG